MSFSDETINLVCERYRTEKFRFSWESGFSSSAGGVKECGGSPATTSTLCPTETSVGTGVGSLEAEDFGVMSLCPRAEQRFCARFAAGNEPPLWYKLTQEPETKAGLMFLLGRVSWVSWWLLELQPEGSYWSLQILTCPRLSLHPLVILSHFTVPEK